jgi:hypothetical protein
MAVTHGKTSEASNGKNNSDIAPPPYLGRSVRIVGPVVNVDMNQSPHPKNQRGELGKPLFNWYHNTVSKGSADAGVGAEPFCRSPPFSQRHHQPG